MGPWLLLLPLLGIGAVVALKGRPEGDDAIGTEPKGDEAPPVVPDATGLSSVRQHAILVGAPKPWQDFFILVAQGESGGNNLVGLGVQTDAPPYVHMNYSTAEAAAAGRAYDRNAEHFTNCWPQGAYEFGSGGWFGLLPANALVAFKTDGELRCLHPWSVFDTKIAMIMAAWFARRLTGWSNWDGTVLSLRVGWGAPEKMGDQEYLEQKRSKFEEDCRQVGLPESFLDTKLARWKPKPASTLFAELGGDRQWLP
jgi:hypothetical protein